MKKIVATIMIAVLGGFSGLQAQKKEVDKTVGCWGGLLRRVAFICRSGGFPAGCVEKKIRGCITPESERNLNSSILLSQALS